MAGRSSAPSTWPAATAARSKGSLPVLKQHNVGAINWGLVQGKAQTHLPWDSWRRPYVDREPAVWFHEVFRNDGTPYDAKETALIKSLTAAQVPR